MGKTYIVTPDYTTRAPSYPWTELRAQQSDDPAEREFADNNDQELIPDTAGTLPGQVENISAQEIAASEDQELAEPNGVEESMPSAIEGPRQDVEATAQSTAVSPALFLGDILTDPLGDELVALNRKDRMNIPTDDIYVPDVKAGFKATRGDLLSGRFGIWATMFAALGLPSGLETGLVLERRSQDIISARTLVTFEFVATQQFVEDSMKLAPVQNYIAGYDSETPPPLYMVTGVKVAYDASLKSTSSDQGHGSLGLQIPGADAQKILEFKKARNKSSSFNNSTPFVLAFRVRKILYKNGQWKHTLSKKGASMMDGRKANSTRGIETRGLGEDYMIDEQLVQDLDYSLFQDGSDAWIIPGDF